jgi:hypothetical protein
MTEPQFNQAIQQGQVNFIPPNPETEELKPFSKDEYQPIIEPLRRPRIHLTDHPTAKFIPRNSHEQIQLVDDGANQYVDIFINGHWYSFKGTLIV